MTFTFRGFSGEMTALRLTSSGSEGHCFRFWFIFSKTDAGGHRFKRRSRDKVSQPKITSSSSCRRQHT